MVDVAEHLEHLVAGAAPPAQCPAGQTLLVPAMSPELAMHLRLLPARDRDPALDRFLARARTIPVEKLENCLTATPRRPVKAQGTSRAIYVALGLSVVLLGALVAVALGLWRDRGEPTPVATVQVPVPAQPAQPAQPAFTRPEWILSDVPASAYCHELINRLMCVGVSSYRQTRDDAVTEANDAALEELVTAVGLKITDPYFRETVVPGYNVIRSKALSELQAADLDRTSEAYAKASEVVRKARKRVAEILQASGGAAVPSQRSDWYWEEYPPEKGKGPGNETLVFIRYDISIDAMKALVEKYSATTTVMGNSVLTAFPALAWQHADFAGGALITKVGRPLAGSGIAPQAIVTAIGDQRVSDATVFVRRLEEAMRAPGPLKLSVKTGDAPVQEINIRR
jgi:hypothetical protein